MQNIVIDKPYKFVPPKHSHLWPGLIRPFLPWLVKKYHGIESTEFIGLEKLRHSIDAGHGIVLAPNHCRPCDPMILSMMPASLSQPLYIMASWHLFMQGPLLSWILPRMGVFSMYREGLDREALKCAAQILTEAKRSLVIFPEGVISRTNDRLNNLMEGTVFIARNAAKQRASLDPPGKVVIHPVAIRYFFDGDIDKTLEPVLEEIEKRFSWNPQKQKSIEERIYLIGDALLSLKEIEFFGEARKGDFCVRTKMLIDQLLVPLEKEWLKKASLEVDVVSRVKTLRSAILPELISGEINEEERSRRWKQLADLYLAQQIYFYPPDYFSSPPTKEQMLETVERFEEDLTDIARIHRPLHATAEIGDAIEVSPVRERGLENDPVMTTLRSELERMLTKIKEEKYAR
jgi:1-acyl-sn-glycerol-3-phosphate acyltransferase